ncbi:hypothetical protein ACTOV4_00625 [Brucella sp. C7-11G]
MLSDEQIEEAKKTTRYSLGDQNHEHPDCIRFAYEWLDAQKKLKNPNKTFRPLKHHIEQWANRYVSQSDVEVAAHLHPDITGVYPHYNISSKLIEPSKDRILDLGQFNIHGYRFDPETYASKE